MTIPKQKARIRDLWDSMYLPGAESWQEEDNFNPYDGVLEKEYRMSWQLERYINEIDRIQEEREWNKKKKRRS